MLGLPSTTDPKPDVVSEPDPGKITRPNQTQPIQKWWAYGLHVYKYLPSTFTIPKINRLTLSLLVSSKWSHWVCSIKTNLTLTCTMAGWQVMSSVYGIPLISDRTAASSSSMKPIAVLAMKPVLCTSFVPKLQPSAQIVWERGCQLLLTPSGSLNSELAVENHREVEYRQL